MGEVHHYPPEVLSLLVDTVPRLCRSKQDVVTFLRGAGVPPRLLQGVATRVAQDPSSITKFAIVRSVLTALNDAGDDAIRPRREIIKRVTEFEDFSRCWESDRLEAEGLVAKLRQVVGVKDSFTRMKNVAERELEQRRRDSSVRLAEEHRRREEMRTLSADIGRLVTEPNPWKRGKALESVLNRLFGAAGILVREAFTVRGHEGQGVLEQIDGLIELDGHLILVEFKWHSSPIGIAEVSPHLVRIFSRGDARGLFISASGFTEAAIQACREALTQKVVILAELREIALVLEREQEVSRMLRKKIESAIADKKPFVEHHG
jgi:restriction system protein